MESCQISMEYVELKTWQTVAWFVFGLPVLASQTPDEMDRAPAVNLWSKIEYNYSRI